MAEMARVSALLRNVASFSIWPPDSALRPGGRRSRARVAHRRELSLLLAGNFGVQRHAARARAQDVPPVGAPLQQALAVAHAVVDLIGPHRRRVHGGLE